MPEMNRSELLNALQLAQELLRLKPPHAAPQGNLANIQGYVAKVMPKYNSLALQLQKLGESGEVDPTSFMQEGRNVTAQTANEMRRIIQTLRRAALSPSAQGEANPQELIFLRKKLSENLRLIRMVLRESKVVHPYGSLTELIKIVSEIAPRYRPLAVALRELALKQPQTGSAAHPTPEAAKRMEDILSQLQSLTTGTGKSAKTKSVKPRLIG